MDRINSADTRRLERQFDAASSPLAPERRATDAHRVHAGDGGAVPSSADHVTTSAASAAPPSTAAPTVIHFEHLGDGWTPEYWDKFYAPEKEGERYFVKLPESPKEDRMFIVSGLGTTRIVFLTDEAEESFFTAPGGND